MTMRLSFISLTFRVWIAFFASVCILASVIAYADDTVYLYYDSTFKTSGTDVGTVLNSGAQGYTLKITGPATHSKKAAIRWLYVYGIDDIRQINVQSPIPNDPYVFVKNGDDLQLEMTDIEYCGNADQNVRSVFVKDEYNNTSYSSMAVYCHDVTISSFVDPDSEVCVFGIVNLRSGITLLSDEGYPNIFSNNKGCIRARAINFNPATTANGSTGDWYFNNNFANNGSVLYCYQLLFKDQGNYSFTGNFAVNNGGAIFSTINYTDSETYAAMCHLNHSRAELNFVDNTAGEKGGAIYGYESEIHIGGKISTFINNRAGIGLDGNLLSDNIASGHGGAIYCENLLNDAPNKLGYVYVFSAESTFESNLAYGDGGAIYCDHFTAISGSQSNFSNNKATRGGAIFTPYMEFSGNNASATFTGNYANFNNTVNEKVYGNDIYCPVDYLYSLSDGYESTNLAFVHEGTYSFDGGIYIEYSERDMYEDDPYNTVINKSQVTIAGRANDSTNYYQFRRASISNSGKLTAKLDEIEGVNGIITMDNTAKLELNVTGANPKKLTMNIEDVNTPAQDDDLAVQGSGVIEKTGDGTLQILAEAEGLVCAESFVVSSGRLDYRGYFTGSVEVGGSEADAVFSPGNSVGDAYVQGNVKILNSGAALFEFGKHPDGEYPDDDSNHDVLNITNGKFSAGNKMISLYFEKSDADDWSYDGCKYLLVSGANLPNGDYTSWLDNYKDLFSLLSEDNNLYLVYPLPEPLPEPSTIALLLLGVAGLLYVRKRKN